MLETVKKKIAKKLGIQRVDKRVQQAARRELVILLSALLFVLLPMILSLIVFGIWFGRRFGSTLEGLEIPVFFGVILVSSVIGLTIGGLLWTIAMSFYLTMEEYVDMANMPAPHIPILSPLFRNIGSIGLKWKIQRERRSGS
jgi:high-affinity K+ transport system ATPase subunit B